MADYQEWADSSTRMHNHILARAFLFRSYRHNNNSYTDARCKFCQTEFLKTKPIHLMEHCTRCPDVPDDVQGQVAVRPARLSSADHETIDKLLVLFMATNCLALNTLDTPSTKKFIAALSPSNILPTRHVFTRRLLPRQATEARDFCINNILAAPEYSICIEVDAWTGCNDLHYIAIVLTSRRGTAFLLDLIEVS